MTPFLPSITEYVLDPKGNVRPLLRLKDHLDEGPEAWKRLLTADPCTAVLVKPKREHFWNLVKRKRLVCWEGTSQFVQGVIWHPGSSEVQPAVYDLHELTQFLAENTDFSKANEHNSAETAARSYILRNLRADLPGWPWYIVEKDFKI